MIHVQLGRPLSMTEHTALELALDNGGGNFDLGDVNNDGHADIEAITGDQLRHYRGTAPGNST